MSRKKVFTESQTKAIIEYYCFPHSLNDTAKFAGITKTKIIRELLIKNGIELHSREKCKNLQQSKQQEYFVGKNKKTFKTLVTDELIKAAIIQDYIYENAEFTDIVSKYELSWAMLGRLLRAWDIKKDKSKQTNNLTKNKFKKYDVDKQSLQSFFDDNTIEETAKHFKIPEHFLYKIINSLEIDWTLHNKNVPNGSKPEEIYYKELIKKYGKADVKRQYNEDPRYPFHCDFYIVSEDKFIELNYHWTHGGHPFDKNNEEDVQKLSEWRKKAETSKFYKVAVHVWAVSDPLKLEYMTKNNLNYEIIYSR